MTTLTIEIDDDLMQRLRERAAARNVPAEALAAEVLRDRFPRELGGFGSPEYMELMRPVHEAFEASGMTEEELAELIGEEREAMYRERAEAHAASNGTNGDGR